MATKFETEKDVDRGELLFIDPDDIAINDSLNGRWEPHSEDEIDQLAESIASEGQLQPVEVRKNGVNQPELVSGYRRYHAIKKLNKGKKAENRIKVKCVVVTANDEEAFRHNITENKNRKSTSPVDDAHNQRRLRDNFGWNDTKIAEFYQKSPSYITLLKKILLLPVETQAKVHRGELALNAAALLVELTPEEQAEVLKPEPPSATGTEGAAAPPEGGKKAKKKGGRKQKGGKGGVPTTGTIINRVRGIKAKGGGKKKPNKGGGEAPKPTSRTSRSMAEVRRFFESLTGPGERKVVRETAEFMLDFVNGKWVDDTAEKKFKELYA